MEAGNLISLLIDQALEIAIDTIVESAIFHLLGAAVIGAGLWNWFTRGDDKAKIAALEKSNQTQFELNRKQGKRLNELEEQLGQSKQVIDKIPPPETVHWITKQFAIVVIRDHPAGRKHMPNRPLASGLADLEEIIEGKPSRSSHERHAAEAILDEITHQHPEVIHDGAYSQEVLEWALNRRLISDS